MNCLTIRIGQLGLVQLTNRKMGRKHVNKQISRQFVTKLSIIAANQFVYLPSFRLPIDQPNKLQLTNHNCETYIQNWRVNLVSMVLYVFITVFLSRKVIMSSFSLGPVYDESEHHAFFCVLFVNIVVHNLRKRQEGEGKL